MPLQLPSSRVALLLGLCLGCSPSGSPAGGAAAPAAKAAPTAVAQAPAAATPQAPAANVAAPASGWNPSEACAFLEQPTELRTRGYKQLDADEYVCSTPYKVLAGDGAGLANNLAYYVEGNAARAELLKLVLNVNDKPNAKAALAAFRSTAEVLTAKALETSTPADVLRALAAGKPGTWTVNARHVEVKRDDWPTGKGYSLHYLLRRAD